MSERKVWGGRFLPGDRVVDITDGEAGVVLADWEGVDNADADRFWKRSVQDGNVPVRFDRLCGPDERARCWWCNARKLTKIPTLTQLTLWEEEDLR